MLIISTFEHCLEVEEAVAVLEQKGVERNAIMLIPMDSPQGPYGEDLSKPSGKTTLAFEVGMASATAMSVIGISCGFRLKEGPIIWGILSALAGFFIGGGITQWIVKKSLLPIVRRTKTIPELTLIVRCSEERYPELRQVLWQYRALSVGQANETNV